MSKDEQIKRMRLEILGDIADKTCDEVFELKLEDAEIVALNALYPFDDTKINLPDDIRLKNWQVRCAIELYKKMGTTNVHSYSENGISVTFLTGLVSNQLMNEIVPKVGVPK